MSAQLVDMGASRPAKRLVTGRAFERLRCRLALTKMAPATFSESSGGRPPRTATFRFFILVSPTKPLPVTPKE